MEKTAVAHYKQFLLFPMFSRLILKTLGLVRVKLMKNIILVIKEGKCLLPACSPFPTMFSKAVFLKVVKTWDYVLKS